MYYEDADKTEIEPGTLVRVEFRDGEQTYGEFVRGPRGDGDAFVIRHEEKGIMYIKDFLIMARK